MKLLNGILVLALLSPLAQAQPEPPSKVPGKWFKDAKGYEEALALQKQIGADIILYFTRLVPDDEKGLCRWWEGKGMKTSPVNRALKDFIKVQVTLPSKEADEELARSFRIGKTPVLVVVHPDGWKSYIKPFDWPAGRPDLKDPNEIASLIEASSTKKAAEAEAAQTGTPGTEPAP